MLEYIVRKWILLRMSAEEFSFKKPFDISEEYTIMKSVLFFALVPFELIFVFAYARLFGSLRRYSLLGIILMFLINAFLANLVINSMKDKEFIRETMSDYERLDYNDRKKIYSFKNGSYVLFLTAGLPWMILGISVAVICILFPL